MALPTAGGGGARNSLPEVTTNGTTLPQLGVTPV